MAEQSDLLTNLRETLARYDDEALAALANKGLLRRAGKDLEASTPTLVEAQTNTVRIDTGEAVVTLALPLQGCTCVCPSTGICRHVLLALLWLRKQPAESAALSDAIVEKPEAPLGAELLALTSDEILRWAGTPLARKCAKSLNIGTKVTWTEGRTIDFVLPNREISCRWLPGLGLTGMVCDCHARGACEHRVTALLAYRAAVGIRDVVLDEGEDHRHSLDHVVVLASVGDAVHNLIAHGFSHLSSADDERVSALAISAHTAQMPRLESLLKTLATEIRLQLTRDAQADTGNLLEIASLIEALRLAAPNASSALHGKHRTAYYDTRVLEIQGMGMSRWRTPGGYFGLTVYFWDLRNNEWLTWSDSRPADTKDGFTPQRRRNAPGPWENCESPFKISRRRLTLQAAKRSAEGRISGREATVANVHDPASNDVPAPITSWDMLTERAISLFGGGLAEAEERDAIVYIEPHRWGDAQFDRTSQELAIEVSDERGALIRLIVPFSDETTNSIRLLEQFDWSLGTRLLGMLRLRAEGMHIEPLVIHQGNDTIDLTFDMPRPQSRSRAGHRRSTVARPTPPAETQIGSLLLSALAEMGTIAEGGLTAHHDMSGLRQTSIRLTDVRMEHAGNILCRFVNEFERIRHSTSPNTSHAAQVLLQGYYLLHRSRIIDGLLAAAGGLR